MAVQQISGKLEGPEAAPPAAPGRWRGRGRAFLYRYAVALALALMVVLFSALLPHTFFTVGNFQTIVSSQAVLLILALGLTVPLLVGEFDLSIAAMLGFAAILLTYLTGKAGWAAVPAIAAVLAAGVLVGAVNGLFVVRFGVNAFITTLGTGTVLTGLTLAVSGGQILNGVPQAIVDVASNDFLLGLPAPVFIGLALAVALWFVYDHTPLGRYLFFVGESREVARLAGLRVDRMRWLALVAASVLATVGGILAAGQLGAADPSSGPNFLLPAFAAAFLGATTIKPGRFNAWGTVIAQYVLITGVTGLQTRPRVLLLHDPTQGVDIGSRQQIFRIIREVAEEGVAVVVASAEHEDLAHMCHRVVVMRRGRPVAALSGSELSSERIVEHCYLAAAA